MNFLSINSINLPKIQNITPQQKTHNGLNYGLHISQPLAKDTISFGATPKEGFCYNRGISKKVAKDIHSYYNQFKSQIDAIFTLLLASLVVSVNNSNNIVEYTTSRTKSSDSIVEKSNTREWNTKKSVIDNMTDILGGKIVMNIGSKSAVNKVLDEFCKAIANKQIQLIEIENKVPKFLNKKSFKEAEKYSYASLKSLEKLYDAQANQKNGIVPNYKKEEPFDYNDTNYTALHLLFKVPVKNDNEIKWVTVECQIMGHDVAQFKNLDDVLFKVLNGKNVDKKYKNIQNILKPIVLPKKLINKNRTEILKMSDAEMIENGLEKYINIPREQLWENIVLRKEFDAYRAETFLRQREKEPIAPQDRSCELEAFAYLPPDPKKYPHLCRYPRLYMGYLYQLKQQADNGILKNK